MKFLGSLLRRNSMQKVKKRVLELSLLCSDQRKKNDALNSSLKQTEQTLRSIASALHVISLAGDNLDDIPADDVDIFLSVLRKAKKLMIRSKEEEEEKVISPEDLKQLEDSLMRFRWVDIGHLAAVGMMKCFLVNTEEKDSIGKSPDEVLYSSVVEVRSLLSDAPDEIKNGRLELSRRMLSQLAWLLFLMRRDKLDIPAESIERFVASLIHVKTLVSAGEDRDALVKIYDMGSLSSLLSFYTVVESVYRDRLKAQECN